MSDDLFAPQNRLPLPQARPIVCVVCKRPGTPDATRPLLCDLCGSDLPATRAHVVNMVLMTEQRADRAADAVDDATQALDDKTRARYDAYNTAVIASDPRAATVEAQARSGRDEPLLNYVRLWLEYCEADEAARDVNAWSVLCEEAIDAI